MQNTEYIFSSAIHNNENSSATNTVLWTIPNLEHIINSSQNDKIIIRTDKRKDYADTTEAELQFELMLVIGDVVEFWFLSPTSKYIRTDLHIIGNHVAGRSDKVQANKWQLLTMQLKKNCLANIEYVLSTGYTVYELKFVFCIEYNAPAKSDDTNKSSLNSDLLNLFKISSLVDVTIISNDGIEISAHKAILAARSAVFKAHFDHGTKETVSNVLESPFDEATLIKVLLYMYTDSTVMEEDALDELLMAADFYLLEGLKLKCEEALHKNLSVGNAIKTLKLADQYSALNLKELTLKYINNGRIGDVMKTEDYQTLKSVELIKSIFEYNYK